VEVVEMAAPAGNVTTPALPVARVGGRMGLARRVVGSFFLFTAGVHLGIVASDAEVYRHFADSSLVPPLRDAWAEVFMATPSAWGLAVMAGELTLGLLLLAGGTWARAGWVGVIGFHVALMLFGWGFWIWSVPVLVFLVVAARRDWPALGT
jgi:hypothetical protein